MYKYDHLKVHAHTHIHSQDKQARQTHTRQTPNLCRTPLELGNCSRLCLQIANTL